MFQTKSSIRRSTVIMQAVANAFQIAKSTQGICGGPLQIRSIATSKTGNIENQKTTNFSKSSTIKQMQTCQWMRYNGHQNSHIGRHSLGVLGINVSENAKQIQKTDGQQNMQEHSYIFEQKILKILAFRFLICSIIINICVIMTAFRHKFWPH